MLKVTILIDDTTLAALEGAEPTLFGVSSPIPWTYCHPADVITSAIQQYLDGEAISSLEEFQIRRNPGTDLLELSYVGKVRYSRWNTFAARWRLIANRVLQVVSAGYPAVPHSDR